MHGASMHRELELLVKAGLTPVEALAAATSVPAERFRLPDRGRIAPGMRADLLLVKGDPTSDITATRKIARIWKQGVEVYRDAFLADAARDRADAERLRAGPAPAGSESGLVSDFEGESPSATFGAGWSVSTDSIRGGTSEGEIRVAPGGANGSKGSLSIAGEIRPDLPYAWAGAMFSPGPEIDAPANLSSRTRVSFWAKGDGTGARIMLFSKSDGSSPGIRTFVPGPEWKQFTFPLAAFNGMDGSDLTGIFFGGGPDPGRFEFQIDDVRLSSE
jgi:hypothetical protein